MIGAIIGDICGSRFEANNIKAKDFDLMPLGQGCCTTDDSIMTMAVAQAILDCKWASGSLDELKERAIYRMREFGRLYPNAGYGRYFYSWIFSTNPKPYNSFGNGAAMRVSPCGFAARSLQEAIDMAVAVTEVTHNHPEALKAAETVAAVIFLARQGKNMTKLKDYVEKHYCTLDFTLDDIRPTYHFDVSCQGSVPIAFEAFFEATDFEDAIRNAISVGGDSDTIAAIVGGMAEAKWGVPMAIRERAEWFLNKPQKELIEEFESKAWTDSGMAPLW